MPNRTIHFLIVLCLFAFISYCFAEDLGYRDDEILVRFTPKPDKSQRSISEKNQVLSALNVGTVLRSEDFLPGLTLVKLRDNLTVSQALNSLKNNSAVLHAQPNFIYRALATFPNEVNSPGRFNEQWSLHNEGQSGGTTDADIDAPEAWDIITDSNIIVAVIDSGVDYTHPDLAGNMWTDANGHYGYDFVNNDNYPMDDFGHGTHVSGTIGAVGNNSIGITGVCWNVKIMALKFLDSHGEGDTYDAIASIDYAVQMGAKVLNNSWGGPSQGEPEDTDLKNKIETANTNGVIFVAAAGNYPQLPWYDNDITPVYPANYDCNNIISVMATNPDDGIAYYSHYGAKSVDLSAPGGEMYYAGDPNGILSTIPGNSYDFYQGTSMAAPHVAGACALVWAANPTWTHLQVKNRIMGSVDFLDSLEGRCVMGGRFNLYNAIAWPFPVVGPVIFVDKDANGLNNGTSWDNAYLNLHDAIFAARRYVGQAKAIWVAEGTYKPVGSLIQDYQNKSFKLYNDVPLFGHFGGIGTYETSTSQRNFSDPNNETILNGEISQGNYVYNVVISDGTTGAILDGFTITGAKGEYDDDCGIKLDNGADISIVNCKIWNNYYGLRINNNSRADIHNCTFFSDNDSAHTGIESLDSTLNISNSVFTSHSHYSIDASSTYLTVTDSNFIESLSSSYAILSSGGQADISGCLIQNEGNNGEGILCSDGGDLIVTDCNIQKCDIGLESSQSDVNVIHCCIHANKYSGINASNSNVNIKRSYIYENDYYNYSAGIYLISTGNFKILNNWIFRNSYGIHLDYVDSVTEIRNNTIAYNTYDGIIRSGGASYPEIKNCILWNPEGDDLDNCSATYSCIYDNDTGTGVIHSDPCFYLDENDDYHLTGVSPCIDTGNGTYNETDIDGENRVMDGDYNGTEVVDRGADEYYHPKADYNGDEIVNFLDYSIFANNWLDVNAAISLDTDSDVDIDDLALFCEDWLWYAPWGQGYMMCMGGGGGEMYMSESVSPQLYVGGYYPTALSWVIVSIRFAKS